MKPRAKTVARATSTGALTSPRPAPTDVAKTASRAGARRRKARRERATWPALAHDSFVHDWDNDLDAAYDDWKARYGVSER